MVKSTNSQINSSLTNCFRISSPSSFRRESCSQSWYLRSSCAARIADTWYRCGRQLGTMKRSVGEPHSSTVAATKLMASSSRLGWQNKTNWIIYKTTYVISTMNLSQSSSTDSGPSDLRLSSNFERRTCAGIGQR